MRNNFSEDILIEQDGARYADAEFCGRVTVARGVNDVVFEGCRFTSLEKDIRRTSF